MGVVRGDQVEDVREGGGWVLGEVMGELSGQGNIYFFFLI